uniref:Guanylate kinase (Trinotate prediction) n=1 Tax=Henneguya salminicola TaxID=69463 RepID=A0A6G3MIB3_HENSL
MEKMIANNELIEYTIFSTNIYGTGKKDILKLLECDKVCILDLDIKGVISIKKSNIPAIFACIKPLAAEELIKRLQTRHTETPKSIQTRIEAAKKYDEFSLFLFVACLVNENNIFDAKIENINLDAAVNDFISLFKEKYSYMEW